MFDLIQNMPEKIDPYLFNKIADQSFQQWSLGTKNKDKILEFIDDSDHKAEIYEILKASDEFLITKKVPHLSREKRLMLFF